MACATLGTLVLTATLLGHASLTVESQTLAAETNASSAARGSAKTHACLAAATPQMNEGNAELLLKDASGRTVYTGSLKVARFHFYESTETGKYEGGVAPAKAASVIVKYPVNDETAKAVTVELRAKDGTYSQTARLPVDAKAKTTAPLLFGLK